MAVVILLDQCGRLCYEGALGWGRSILSVARSLFPSSFHVPRRRFVKTHSLYQYINILGDSSFFIFIFII